MTLKRERAPVIPAIISRISKILVDLHLKNTLFVLVTQIGHDAMSRSWLGARKKYEVHGEHIKNAVTLKASTFTAKSPRERHAICLDDCRCVVIA